MKKMNIQKNIAKMAIWALIFGLLLTKSAIRCGIMIRSSGKLHFAEEEI